jgi:hypothetical protein
MAACAAPFVHPRLAVADIRAVQVTAQQQTPGEFREWAAKRIAEMFGTPTPSMPASTNWTPGSTPPKVIEHQPVEVEPEPEPVAASVEPVEGEPADAHDAEPVDEPEELPAAYAERHRVVRLRRPRREADF